MADLTISTVVIAGVSVTLTPAATGDAFVNDGRTVLIARNVNASSRTVTVESQRPVVPGYGQADNAVVVPTGGLDKIIGPFDPLAWNDSTGRCQITYSVLTDVSIAAVRLPLP